jgi:hypothetical protein
MGREMVSHRGKIRRGSTGQPRYTEMFPAAPSVAWISDSRRPASPIRVSKLAQFRIGGFDTHGGRMERSF